MWSEEDAALAKGMLLRGDLSEQVAIYFGKNYGRMKDLKTQERYARIAPAPLDKLPPPGPYNYKMLGAAMTVAEQRPAQALIDATSTLTEQIQTLIELMKTTPRGAPAIVVEFSPELAQHILTEFNVENRNPRPSKIRDFADDMRDGLWELTGETVKFSDDRLLDGQNRFRACVLSGQSFCTYAVFGIDRKAFQFVDSGAGRNGGDTFKVFGVANPTTAARATRWLMILRPLAEGGKIDRGVTVPNDELFAFYQKNVNQNMLQKQIERTREISHRLPKASLAAMLYLFERRNHEQASIFAHDLAKEIRGGKHLIAKIKHLYDQTGRRVKETWITAYTIQAWNSYRQGKIVTGVRQLNWTDDQPHPVIE